MSSSAYSIDYSVQDSNFIIFKTDTSSACCPTVPPEDYLQQQSPPDTSDPTETAATTQQPCQQLYIMQQRHVSQFSPATEQFQNSAKTAIAWNHLDNTTAQSKSVDSFKMDLPAAKPQELFGSS